MTAIEPKPASRRRAPIVHPMDPRRGESLSPMFAAFLVWLLQLPPMTEPAITGISVTGGCVYAATGHAPFHDTFLGPWADLESNLRAWGAVCGADPAAIDALVRKARRNSQ